MVKFFVFIAFLLLTGCASVDYTPGKVYRVTSGYVANSSSSHPGNEFLFSLVPPAGKWGYARGKPWFKTNRGYISFISPNLPEIGFSWIWTTNANFTSDLSDQPHLVPWINGVHPTMERVLYVPSERQIKSGDWNQPGYRQRQWHQFRYLGKKPYYCMTALATSREGTIQYGTTRQVPYNAYWYNIVCPFHVTDGRNATFVIRSVFSIRDEQLAQNPNRVEENIEHIHRMLEPTWNSLVIMPKAYQLEPPVTAP